MISALVVFVCGLAIGLAVAGPAHAITRWLDHRFGEST